MTLAKPYLYIPNSYVGHLPLNRELVEQYPNGAIYRVPATTTMSFEVIAMLTPSRSEVTRRALQDNPPEPSRFPKTLVAIDDTQGIPVIALVPAAKEAHHPGCSSSRGRSCTCEYLEQWW